MKNQNQMYQKDKKVEGVTPANVIAEIVGCSPSLVTQVRNGSRNAKKGAGAKVLVIDELYKTGESALVEHLKTIVPLI